MATCTICGKRSVSGSAVSHSKIFTKRKFKPNLQKVRGIVLCTKCHRTGKRQINLIFPHSDGIPPKAVTNLPN